MPRQARKKSESGVYHIILRGINQQVIFEDKLDYIRFIDTLKKYKNVCGFKLYAYCLMSNHIHMLLKVENEDLDLIMKRFSGSYVYWYNLKHHRTGHLFQDRFKSYPVEDDAYLLTVLRYIHQNPKDAGYSEKLDKYEYSSYKDYLNDDSSFVDLDFINSIIDKEEFISFHKVVETSEFEGADVSRFRMTDAEAAAKIKELLNCNDLSVLQSADMATKREYVSLIKKNGISMRQFSRLTGISKNIR